MNFIHKSLALCVLLAACQIVAATITQADENGDAGKGRVANKGRSDARLSEARRAATEKRREWLRKHLTAGQHDREKLAQLNAQLDSLNDQQIDIAAVRMLEQLDKRRSRDKLNRANGDLARALKTRETLRRMAAARHGAMVPSPAGFYPVITVLPTGASLTASAVVSPDRRHVRVNVNPFFSSIGPVDTFNFYTGETHRHYSGDAHRLPEFNQRRREHRHEPLPVAPRYDGLRTRNDRVPRR
jgi:hypothetical protein